MPLPFYCQKSSTVKTLLIYFDPTVHLTFSCHYGYQNSKNVSISGGQRGIALSLSIVAALKQTYNFFSPHTVQNRLSIFADSFK